MSKKKDIVIEVMTPSKQYEYVENWERLDTYQDQKMTLQYISNLLTGVESITSSSTLSVKLPRTVRNERIFDLATRPQYNSTMTHRKIECRVYINGIDMMKDAYCYILDCESDNYEVAIVFGLLQHYGQWLTNSPGLRDLRDREEYILWNGKCAVDCGSIWWSNYPSCYNSYGGNNLASQFYALYNCGLERNATTLNHFNLHPCVTLREIYERIIEENNLNFVMPASVLRDMENLAIVQVERNQPEVGQEHTEALSASSYDDIIQMRYGRIQSILGGLVGCINIANSDYYTHDNRLGYVLYKGEGYIRLEWDFYLRPYTGTNRVFGEILNALHETYGNLSYVRLAIYDFTTGQMLPTYAPTSYSYIGGTVSNVRFSGSHTFTNTGNIAEGSAIAEIGIWLDPQMMRIPGQIPYIGYYFQTNNNDIFNYSGYTQLQTLTNNNYYQYTYVEGTTPYPNNFLLIPNLPDISQLDFIKAICQMYCLFPVVNRGNAEQIDFVPFDIIQENTLKPYDWSDKLIEYARDVPKRISFRAGDYARRNIIQYKDDDAEKYPYHSEAVLGIDDDTLDKEKTLIEFPWAATKVDRITQYQIKLSEDDQRPEYEFIQCEYRLMRIVEWQRQSDCANVALFQDLDAEYILATYYSTYQGTIRKPRIITEHIRLNELEMRDIDFTRPVYLRKYGRFYAIKQIQWTVGDDYAECELLQL